MFKNDFYLMEAKTQHFLIIVFIFLTSCENQELEDRRIDDVIEFFVALWYKTSTFHFAIRYTRHTQLSLLTFFTSNVIDNRRQKHSNMDLYVKYTNFDVLKFSRIYLIAIT